MAKDDELDGSVPGVPRWALNTLIGVLLANAGFTAVGTQDRITKKESISSFATKTELSGQLQLRDERIANNKEQASKAEKRIDQIYQDRPRDLTNILDDLDVRVRGVERKIDKITQ